MHRRISWVANRLRYSEYVFEFIYRYELKEGLESASLSFNKEPYRLCICHIMNTANCTVLAIQEHFEKMNAFPITLERSSMLSLK